MVMETMSSRKRFNRTLSFEKADRVPFLKEGIREDVLEEWRTQGLGKSTEIEELFAYDRRHEICLDLGPLPPLDVWPRNLSELELLASRLDPADEARYPEGWSELKRTIAEEQPIVIIRLHQGFFLSMGVYDWDRFLDVIYMLQDDPDFVRALMILQGEFAARLVDRLLAEISIDAALFSEPIGGNDRPLLPPDMYEDFVCPSYQPLFSVLDKHNVQTRIFRTYANVRQLLPLIVNCGFNCLWACEVNIVDMDYVTIRHEFGTALSLIGGIDLDTLRRDERAITEELLEKVPPLLASGGYIPLADGRVRSDVPFQNYVHYRRLLEELTGKQ